MLPPDESTALDAESELLEVSNPTMRRLARILSFVLLTVWFPATQHCNLEAAGLITLQCSDDCLPGQHVSNDGCDVVENGAYKSGAVVIKVPAPELLACGCFLCLHFVSPTAVNHDAVLSVVSFERPLDWVTTWQFVRRAAPSPRAPSLSVA